MKKFSKIVDQQENITNKESSLDFKSKKSNNTSTDIEDLKDQLKKEIDSTKLDGEWEIQSIQSISLEPPSEEDLIANEAIVINAELGNKPVKRGDFIYITALINKKGGYVHQNQMGVLKCRITEIYNTLLILNQLK